MQLILRLCAESCCCDSKGLHVHNVKLERRERQQRGERHQRHVQLSI